MKIKLLLLILLLIAGAVLGFFYYENRDSINDTAYTDSLSLLNRIKQIDAELNVLLLRSRYGLQADYDELARKNIQLSQSVADIQESNIGNYLTKRAELEDIFKDYADKVVIKVDLVESFKSHNAVLRNSIKYAPPLGDSLVAELKSANSSSTAFLESMNRSLYRWSLYGTKDQAEFIQANLGKITDLSPQFDDQIPLLEYNAHIVAVVDEQEQTQQYLENALSLDLATVLDRLEPEYAAMYIDTVTAQNARMNYAVLAYRLLALLVAGYFAWHLRKSYLELEDKVKERTHKVDQAYQELKRSQEQLVQSEKMASLGQMIAGVAHEINTPLGYVSNNVSIVNSLFKTVNELMEKLGGVYSEAVKKPYDKKELSDRLSLLLRQYHHLRTDNPVDEARELLDDSSQGLADISDLVKNLRTFSRLDLQTLERFNICDGLESTLKIASNVLRQHQVDVVKRYIDGAYIDCNPSKINQVFLNIITNAAQAMPKTGGQLTIDVEKIDDNLIVRFSDNGQGMDNETRAKMFDPFFTTKSVGEGTGLGMAISYKIVKEHGGTIAVTSEVGRGTEVLLTFPLQSNDLLM